MKQMLIMVVLAGCCAAVLPATAQDARDVFRQANEAYDAKQFDQAVELYERVFREHDVVNGYLFFNLGNAWFRQGEVGRALLYYRRAQRLIPRYEDLRRNVQVVSGLREDAGDDNEPADLWAYLDTVRRGFTLNEQLASGLVLYGILLGAVLARLWLGRRATVRVLYPYVLWPALGLLVVVSLAAAATVYQQRIEDRAVVVATVAPIRTGPGGEEHYPRLFRLHAGTDVRVLDRHVMTQTGRPYVKVETRQGHVGWTAQENIEPIRWERNAPAVEQSTRQEAS